MKQWSNIIIHNSASKFGNALIIDEWHRERGFTEIGYQFVILNQYPWSTRTSIYLFDGLLEPGRKMDMDVWAEENEIGAHALGYNSTSIGIVLIGDKDFSDLQFLTLKKTIEYLIGGISTIKTIMGHYETDSGKAQGKTCPNFDVPKFLKTYDIKV